MSPREQWVKRFILQSKPDRNAVYLAIMSWFVSRGRSIMAKAIKTNQIYGSVFRTCRKILPYKSTQWSSSQLLWNAHIGFGGTVYIHFINKKGKGHVLLHIWDILIVLRYTLHMHYKLSVIFSGNMTTWHGSIRERPWQVIGSIRVWSQPS